jgi:hypothetical protein
MMSRGKTIVLAGAVLLVGAAAAVVVFIFLTQPDPVDDQNRPVNIETAGYKTPLVVSVQAFYPGANAQTVADTVAAPVTIDCPSSIVESGLDSHHGCQEGKTEPGDDVHRRRLGDRHDLRGAIESGSDEGGMLRMLPAYCSSVAAGPWRPRLIQMTSRDSRSQALLRIGVTEFFGVT